MAGKIKSQAVRHFLGLVCQFRSVYEEKVWQLADLTSILTANT